MKRIFLIHIARRMFIFLAHSSLRIYVILSEQASQRFFHFSSWATSQLRQYLQIAVLAVESSSSRSMYFHGTWRIALKNGNKEHLHVNSKEDECVYLEEIQSATIRASAGKLTLQSQVCQFRIDILFIQTSRNLTCLEASIITGAMPSTSKSEKKN